MFEYDSLLFFDWWRNLVNNNISMVKPNIFYFNSSYALSKINISLFMNTLENMNSSCIRIGKSFNFLFIYLFLLCVEFILFKFAIFRTRLMLYNWPILRGNFNWIDIF